MESGLFSANTVAHLSTAPATASFDGLHRDACTECEYDGAYPKTCLHHFLLQPTLLPCRRVAPCELAPPHHSIISSARLSSMGGTSRPSALGLMSPTARALRTAMPPLRRQAM